MRLPATLADALVAHARDDFPNECCGLIAGRDGTLEGRMRGTSASGNAHAKTGTRTGVRALAGYVDTQDGERLGFAILANNFQTGNRNVVRIIDRAVARLADFSRE